MECKIYNLHSGIFHSSPSLVSKHSYHGTKQLSRCYFCAGYIAITGMLLLHLEHIYSHILEFSENFTKILSHSYSLPDSLIMNILYWEWGDLYLLLFFIGHHNYLCIYPFSVSYSYYKIQKLAPESFFKSTEFLDQ